MTKKPVLMFLLLLSFGMLQAQSIKLNLEECYQLARKNYPLIKKQDLISQSSNYSLANASKQYLPQITINGQASYQSQTLNLPAALAAMPGISLPVIDKDQYKIQAEVTQQLYDGGNTRHQKATIMANQALQEQNLEVILYNLNERVNQIYFSILLMEEQLKQNELRKSDLQGSAAKVEAALKNGTAFRSNLDQVKAELINADMVTIELNANRMAYLQMLGLLIAKSLENDTQLAIPVSKIGQTTINRPELKAYDLQKKVYDAEEQKLNAAYLPQLNAFFQGAYGKPTLNMFENKFGPWYITGIRLNWNLASLYTLKNNRNILTINRQNVAMDQETFLLNTQMLLAQQNIEEKKYMELIEADKKAVALRENIKNAAKAQLDNGVITIHDYISQLNTANLAQQTLILHQIQLLQTQFQVKQTAGN